MDIIIDKSEATMPTQYYGEWKICAFKTKDNLHHAALVKGDVKNREDVLVRIHSECLSGDVFHSERCDCGEQLETAMKSIDKEGMGVLLYLRQEGRGIGLFNKIKAYELQENGRDTVEANEELGFQADLRDYSLAVTILNNMGIKSIKLMTNNPKKIEAMKGIKISKRVPIVVKPRKNNKYYLDTKQTKLGHILN